MKCCKSRYGKNWHLVLSSSNNGNKYFHTLQFTPIKVSDSENFTETKANYKVTRIEFQVDKKNPAPLLFVKIQNGGFVRMNKKTLTEEQRIQRAVFLPVFLPKLFIENSKWRNWRNHSNLSARQFMGLIVNLKWKSRIARVQDHRFVKKTLTTSA